jgi:hypothetical protein
MSTKKTKHDTLDRLIAAGIVFVEAGEYCGIASDGEEVTFGLVGLDEASVERYLQIAPSPDKW